MEWLGYAISRYDREERLFAYVYDEDIGEIEILITDENRLKVITLKKAIQAKRANLALRIIKELKPYIKRCMR